MNEHLCIVLKSHDYRDNDMMVTMFSRDSGRVSCLARGVKSPKSHNASAVQPLCCGFYQFTEKNGYKYLSHTEIKKNYAVLASDYDVFVCACSLVSFTDKLLDFISDYNEMFVLLVNCINALSEHVSVLEVKVYFMVKLLDILGVFPSLNECVVCGKDITDPFYFCHDEGGIVCHECAMHVRTVRITKDDIDTITALSCIKPVKYRGYGGADEKLYRFLICYLKLIADLDFK